MSDVRRILGFVKPYTWALIASVVLMAIAGAGQGLFALLIKPVFDTMLDPNADAAPVVLFQAMGWQLRLDQIVPPWFTNVWTMMAIALIGIFVIKSVCDYGGNYLINYTGLSAITDLRQRVFNHVLRQDAYFFERHSAGRLMSNIMTDIDKIQVATSHILADWLRQTFTAIALLIVVISTDWRLAVVSLVILPTVLVPTIRIGRRIRRTTRTAQDHAAEITQVLQENISGHHVVKSFASEEYESNRFYEAALRFKSATLRYVAQQATVTPLIEIFGALTIVALLTYARQRIGDGEMTVGAFTSFIIALLMLYEPVKRLAGIHTIFQQATGASERVFQYLDEPERVASKPGAIRMPAFSRSIEFRGAGFHYQSAPDGFHIRNVNLTVNFGEIVALVGPSGAGKSTLASLVARFHDVTEGAILIDGHDLRDLELASLRSQISAVAQDTFLFNDTVGNNIRYGRRDATDEQVREAARNSLAEQFIDALPKGFDTVIGERGAKLSGGQRQRIAIARALVKNAPILILDEATSHLDTESESLVQRALANLMEDRTVIVIAHRLSTVRRANKIVVVENGSISETGTHDELVAGGGIYQRLHELQFLEADPLVNP